MTVSFFFKWFDFWVGWYWERRSQSLYICPLPMVGVKLCFCKHDNMMFARSIHGDEIIEKGCRSLFWCPACDMVIGSQMLVTSPPAEARNVLKPQMARVAATSLLAQLQAMEWDRLKPNQTQLILEMSVRFGRELPIDNPVLRNSLNALMSVRQC